MMADYDSIGPCLQIFGTRFLNWRSRDFEVRKILILPESTAFYLLAGHG